MMQAHQLHLIPIDLYQRDLALHVGEWRGMIFQLSSQMEDDELKDLYDAPPAKTERGRFLLLRSGLSVIWLRAGRSPEETALTLQHEIAHCAFSLLKKIGISFCPESEEAYTYLIEYLTGEAWKKLGISPASDAPSAPQ